MRWGGIAGDGLQSTGLLLQKYFNKLGFFVQGTPGTQSTIRGGHVWQHVEISSKPMKSYDRPLNLLIALNDQALEVHGRDLREDGMILFNQDNVSDNALEPYRERGLSVLGIHLTALAREVDLQTPILANTVAVGTVLHLLGFQLEPYREVLKKRFVNREKIINMNLQALKAGYQSVTDEQQVGKLVPVEQDQSHRIVVNGNDMIALGAAASGLKFLAQYPITPASSILTYLSNRAKKYGIVVRQAEDELAAINMIIGASFAGARAMTASSGPGLSLMAESFGYASMTETAIVVVNAMRGGPSTGIPTKMEQSDLNAMIHLSHGEAPRVVLAPRNIEEAYYLTVRAFNLADRFQIPVIILSDFALSERTENIEPVDLDVEIDRGKLWTEPTAEFPQYKRYQITDDGISPRVFPGTKDAQYILVGAEHDEESHSLSGNRCGLPSSWEIRDKMIAKRYRKFAQLQQEMRSPDWYGPQNAEITFICWGSMEGAVQEVVDRLQTQGVSCNLLAFAEIYPLPVEKVSALLAQIKTGIMIEVNYTGQFEDLLHVHCDWQADYRIHPLSGETPSASSLLREIKQLNLEELQ